MRLGQEGEGVYLYLPGPAEGKMDRKVDLQANELPDDKGSAVTLWQALRVLQDSLDPGL